MKRMNLLLLTHHIFSIMSLFLSGTTTLRTIPIYNDTINDIAGYVVINMEQKKQVAGTVYPELLQPQSNSTEIENTEYAYAAYANGKLIRQTNDTYPFTTYLKNDQLKKAAI